MIAASAAAAAAAAAARKKKEVCVAASNLSERGRRWLDKCVQAGTHILILTDCECLLTTHTDRNVITSVYIHIHPHIPYTQTCKE
jgi:hypothetical protein